MRKGITPPPPPRGLSAASAFVFALIVLSVVFSPLSARAQGPPQGWAVVLDSSGWRTGDFLASQPASSRTLTNDHSNPISWGCTDRHANVSLSVIVKLQWTGTGTPTAPPNAVLLNAGALAQSQGGGTGVASANDGLGDRLNVTTTGFGSAAQCGGKHIIPVPTGSGSPITLGTWTLTASGYSNASTSLRAMIDPRKAFITSDIEPNYTRVVTDPPGNGRQTLNLRSPNGDMTVDCLDVPYWLPGAVPITITYYGNAFGWSVNSSYEWRSSFGSLSANGSSHGGYFNPWPLQSDTGYYRYGVVRSGTTDTITLAVVDGYDGAQGEGHYTVRFHDNYDDPKSVISQQDKPRPYNQHPEDWQAAGLYENISNVSIPTTMTVKVGQQLGWKLTLGGETKVPPVLAAVFSKVTVGGEMSSVTTQEYSQAPLITVPPHTRAKMFGTTQSTYKQGFCSQYAYSGYLNDAPFSGTEYGAVAIAGPLFEPL